MRSNLQNRDEQARGIVSRIRASMEESFQSRPHLGMAAIFEIGGYFMMLCQHRFKRQDWGLDLGDGKTDDDDEPGAQAGQQSI